MAFYYYYLLDGVVGSTVAVFWLAPILGQAVLPRELVVLVPVCQPVRALCVYVWRHGSCMLGSTPPRLCLHMVTYGRIHLP